MLHQCNDVTFSFCVYLFITLLRLAFHFRIINVQIYYVTEYCQLKLSFRKIFSIVSNIRKWHACKTFLNHIETYLLVISVGNASWQHPLVSPVGSAKVERIMELATSVMTSVEHHGMQPIGYMDIELGPSRGVPCRS